MNIKKVYFAHGQESGPWGTKIKALAEVAKKKGFKVTSVDYQGMKDPDERAQKLVDLKPSADCLVLVGSSMGAYVSGKASEVIHPNGLFLMAPAINIEGYEAYKVIPKANHIEVIHGYNDEIIPPKNVIEYCTKHELALHLVSSDHGLKSALAYIESLFARFLDEVVAL